MKYRLPVLPVLESRRSASADRGPEQFSTVEDLPERLYVDSGSSAIALALTHAGVESGDDVLLPAFHCPTMADPIREIGANAVFYAVNENLSANMDSVHSLLSSRTRALLVAHFFAIGQDLSAVRTLCDKHGIRLIEDCAHTYFGAPGEQTIGSVGDFAIFSTRKFFAGADGGILASARHALGFDGIARTGLVSEIRNTLDVVEEALNFGRTGWWAWPARGGLTVRDVMKRIVATPTTGGGADTAATSDSGPVSRGDMRTMSRISRFALRKSDLFATIEARRRNYQILEDFFADSGRLRPFSTQIPYAPYMYPLIVHNPELYLALRRDGWPIWRWDDSDPDCEVSRHYSQHLLQLACHQSLAAEDVAALGQAVLDLDSALSET